MNTFTNLLSSINWVDIAILVLLIRVIFIGVKTGFVTELFKLAGVLLAMFFGLHYYSSAGGFIARKTNWSLESMEMVFFVLLVSVVIGIVALLRRAFLMIFKFETTHVGVNQWGAGVLAVIRALLLASLIMHGLLLMRVEWFQRQTLNSISHKLALKAAPNTYSFLYHHLIGKIFSKEKFNDDVFNVISRNSVDRKPF